MGNNGNNGNNDGSTKGITITVIATIVILAAVSFMFTGFFIHAGWNLFDVWIGK